MTSFAGWNRKSYWRKFFVNISLSPVEGDVDLLGKKTEDLQTGIIISDDKITGILKNVTDYTGFSSDVDEQSGHYLAVKTGTVENYGYVNFVVELIGGTKGPVRLDADNTIVLLIKDTDTQSIKVTATNGTDEVSKNYIITDLVLEE